MVLRGQAEGTSDFGAGHLSLRTISSLEKAVPDEKYLLKEIFILVLLKNLRRCVIFSYQSNLRCIRILLKRRMFF